MTKGHNWSAKDDAYVRKHYGTKKTSEDIATHLGVESFQVQWRARTLGIQRKKRFWTKAEDAYLTKHYGSMDPVDIGKHFDPPRKYGAINSRARDLGLQKTLIRYTPEEDATLMKRVDDGASYAQIAKEHKRSYASIAKRIGKLKKGLL